jgi:hypothetical protein
MWWDGLTRPWWCSVWSEYAVRWPWPQEPGLAENHATWQRDVTFLWFIKWIKQLEQLRPSAIQEVNYFGAKVGKWLGAWGRGAWYVGAVRG